MEPVILKLLWLLLLCHVICRVKCPLVICFDKHQCLFNFQQLFDVNDVLVVNSGSTPEHCYHRSHYKADVIVRKHICHQRELYIDEFKVLQEQDNCVEEIGTQESRRIYHNSHHILFSEIHNAKP